jgi:hypothetical protein
VAPPIKIPCHHRSNPKHVKGRADLIDIDGHLLNKAQGLINQSSRFRPGAKNQ